MKLPRDLSLSPLAVTRIDAPAIAAVAPTNAGGVEMAAKRTRKPTAMATPCSATPSGARFVFCMTMKAEPDTIAASSQIGCPKRSRRRQAVPVRGRRASPLSFRTPHRDCESRPSKRHQFLDIDDPRDLAQQLHRFLMFFLRCGGAGVLHNDHLVISVVSVARGRLPSGREPGSRSRWPADAV